MPCFSLQPHLNSHDSKAEKSSHPWALRSYSPPADGNERAGRGHVQLAVAMAQGKARRGKGMRPLVRCLSSVRDEHLFDSVLFVSQFQPRGPGMGEWAMRGPMHTSIRVSYATNGNDQRPTTNERREDAAADREAEAWKWIRSVCSRCLPGIVGRAIGIRMMISHSLNPSRGDRKERVSQLLRQSPAHLMRNCKNRALYSIESK